MKIRLKTLFAITVLVAIIVGGVATVLRTKSEVKRLGAVVEESLGQIKGLKTADIRKSSLSNDFVLMSWGNMKWNVELADKTQAEVELAWEAYFYGFRQPTIVLKHGSSQSQQEFAEQLQRIVQATSKGKVLVSTVGH